MGTQWEITPAKQKLFLDTLATGSSISAACAASDIPRGTAYKMREYDADFASKWADAREQGIDRMEDEALRRALDGWDEPLASAGKLLGTVHKYDSSLHQLLLKANRPEKYKDRLDIQSRIQASIVPSESLQQLMDQYLATIEANPETIEAISQLLIAPPASGEG